MTKKKLKLKKNVPAIIGIILAVILVAVLIIRFTSNRNNTPAGGDSASEPEQGSIIENEGSLEIEVPEGEDTFGE